MIYSIIFFIFTVILIISERNKSYKTKDSEFSYGFCIGMSTMLSIGFFCFSLIGPSAQDVIDGKTTFKVIYVNNVPTDSIIVYKEEYQHAINWW